MITSCTSFAETPERSSAARMAAAPRSGALSDESAPRNLPIGVRAAETMTGVREASAMSLSSGRAWSMHRPGIPKANERLANDQAPRKAARARWLDPRGIAPEQHHRADSEGERPSDHAPHGGGRESAHQRRARDHAHA